MNFLSYFLSSVYSGGSPLASVAAATCTVNGEVVECPSWLGAAFIGMGVFMIVIWAIVIISIIGEWKIFEKAGKPGWAAIVPIYNVIVFLEIAKKPTWWVLLCFIPFVNIAIAFVASIALAKTFNKGAGFGIGLIILPFIFFPMLGFGKATYIQ